MVYNNTQLKSLVHVNLKKKKKKQFTAFNIYLDAEETVLVEDANACAYTFLGSFSLLIHTPLSLQGNKVSFVHLTFSK